MLASVNLSLWPNLGHRVLWLDFYMSKYVKAAARTTAGQRTFMEGTCGFEAAVLELCCHVLALSIKTAKLGF